MTRFTYTPAHIAFIREAYKHLSLQDTTAAFNQHFGLNKTVPQIRSTTRNHRITCGRGKGELLKGRYRAHSPGQVAWLKINYPKYPLPELAKAYNTAWPDNPKTKNQLRTFLHNNGINCGRTGHFSAGQKPWNTGTKGVMQPNRTSFKKGQACATAHPLGHERLSKNGYIEIKIAETNPYTGHKTRYKLKHLHLWEQANGPVPKGHCLRFKDGDITNIQPNNLELITRAENAVLNNLKYNATPAELQPTVRLLTKLHIRKGQRVERAKGADK